MAVGDKLVTLDGLKAVYQDLNGNINDLKGEDNVIDNILSLDDMIPIPFKIAGAGYIKNDGTVGGTTSSTYQYTDYIPFGAVTHFVYKRGGIQGTTTLGAATYNANKEFVGHVKWATSQSSTGYLETLSGLTKQEGVVYARFTVFANTTQYGNFALYGDRNQFLDLSNNVSDMRELTENNSYPDSVVLPYTIVDGGIVSAKTGGMISSQTYEYTRFIDVSKYSHIIYSQLCVTADSSDGGIAFYSSDNNNSFVSGEYCIPGASAFGYVTKITPVPSGANYVKLTSRKGTDGFFVRGIRKRPLEGLKLSLLGASVETFPDAVPSGNDVYYTGNNAGIKSLNEIWWKILCNNTGMVPLVIDAWSGSSVAYNYAPASDTTHADTNKTPMCSDLRTGRLDANSTDPDVILITGGTNDYTYAAEGTTPLGDWDGHTAVDREAVLAGQSTFAESYASMLAELHENYPNAIVVGVSLFFTKRGTDLGCSRTNAVGKTAADYNDVIERVCKIMGVPYISIYDVGFNDDNYYDTYAEDSDTETTHPNALGHAVIAKRMIEALPRVIQQFRV